MIVVVYVSVQTVIVISVCVCVCCFVCSCSSDGCWGENETVGGHQGWPGELRQREIEKEREREGG